MNISTLRISLGFNFILTLLLIYLLVDLDDNDYPSDKVKASVEQFLHDYHTAMEKEGLTGEFAYLDSTSQFFWVPPGFDSWISYDSVSVILRNTDPLICQINLAWEDLRIDVLSTKIAVYTGRVSISQVFTDNTKQDLILLETGTVVKRNGKWWILSGQSRVM